MAADHLIDEGGKMAALHERSKNTSGKSGNLNSKKSNVISIVRSSKK